MAKFSCLFCFLCTLLFRGSLSELTHFAFEEDHFYAHRVAVPSRIAFRSLGYLGHAFSSGIELIGFLSLSILQRMQPSMVA